MTTKPLDGMDLEGCTLCLQMFSSNVVCKSWKVVKIVTKSSKLLSPTALWATPDSFQYPSIKVHNKQLFILFFVYNVN